MIQIIKRNGTTEEFNLTKIIDAINQAFLEVDGTLYETDTATDIANDIYKYALTIDQPLSVEEVQNQVEEYLMRSDRSDVAREYIRYRYKKEVARNYGNDFINAVREKLNATNIQNQNANVDEASFGGRTGEASDVVTKQLALDFIVSPKARKNHLENRIYIHDLNSYYVGSHNCLSIPFDDLLANGFNTRQTDVRPARSVNTAFQLVAVIFQLQSLQQFGGVSATHIDWTMVPFVRLSFFKHYLIEYLKSTDEFYKLNLIDLTEEELDDWIDENKAYYLENLGLKMEDFQFNNKNKLNEKFYQCALFETRREIYQAVEAMYHNLK